MASGRVIMWVSEEVRNKVKKKKQHPKESYSEVLDREIS